MIRDSTGWGSSQSDPRREPSSEPRQHGSPRTTIRTKVPHGLAPHATWRIGRVGTWNGDRRGIPWSSPLPVPGSLHGQSGSRFLTVKGLVCAHAQNFAKVQLKLKTLRKRYGKRIRDEASKHSDWQKRP